MTVTKKRLPRPPVPADLNFRTLPYMPLFIEKLKKSRAWAKARSEPLLGFVLINLWTAAWMEIPACSLPNDEDLLAERAGVDLKTWRKLCGKGLYKFGIHSDGRLYHSELVEIAQKVMISREKDAEKKRRYRQASGKENQSLGGAANGSPHPVPRDNGGDKGGDSASNYITKNNKKDDEAPGTAPNNSHNRKNFKTGSGKKAGPKFLRHLGDSRTLADTLARAASGGGRTGTVEMPMPAVALRPARQSQHHADLHMVQALMDTRAGLDAGEAWAIVQAARDAKASNHLACLEDCTELATKLKLAWRGDPITSAARVTA